MPPIPSFEAVEQELSGPLRRYLERFAGDTHDAEDLLQETLLRISRGLAGYEGRSSLKTWAFSIATRTAIDYARRPRGGDQIVPIDDAEAIPETPSEEGSRLVLHEMNACIRGEIDSLPGDYRAAIILHDLEGLTALEAAEIMGCSIATAKVRIHRARARLRKALERDCTFYRDDNQVLRCDEKPSGGGGIHEG